MHTLDLIMFIVCAIVLWYGMHFISGGELTEEMGALVGYTIMVFFTIVYIILFAFWPDWNWSDFNFNTIKTWFKW